MKKVKIYGLKDPNTNEIRYVGKTELPLEKRLYYHIWDLKRCTNKHKINWFNKLLSNNEKPIIFLIEEVNFNIWKQKEKYWINEMRKNGCDLVNYTDGGEGYTSEWLKKLWQNKEYRDFHTNRVTGDKNPFFGKTHSEETKNILRVKCPKRGKEHGCFGKSKTEKEKIKLRNKQPTLKKVKRMTLTGEVIDVWLGLRFMCKELNLDDAAVIRVIKGKNKHHKKFTFAYIE